MRAVARIPGKGTVLAVVLAVPAVIAANEIATNRAAASEGNYYRLLAEEYLKANGPGSDVKAAWEITVVSGSNTVGEWSFDESGRIIEKRFGREGLTTWEQMNRENMRQAIQDAKDASNVPITDRNYDNLKGTEWNGLERFFERVRNWDWRN